MLFINKKTGQIAYIVQYVADEPATLELLKSKFPTYKFNKYINKSGDALEDILEWHNNPEDNKSFNRTYEQLLYFANLYELDKKTAIYYNLADKLIGFTYEDLTRMHYDPVISYERYLPSAD